jgi:DNA-binding response OmpR family regulator
VAARKPPFASCRFLKRVNCPRISYLGQRREGYEVVQARDGAEALDLARARRPALLVLDVMMPRASGLDVTRALRGEGNDVPILLLTASVQERHRAHGFTAGASDFVRKPFSPRELLERIGRLVARGEGTSLGRAGI